MKLSIATLEKLRNLINEETQYRTGAQLVNFFNELGFNDIYSSGFPSRKNYTDEKLKIINDTSDMDLCIMKLFSLSNYVANIYKVDIDIEEFNKYLIFDGWKVVRNNKNITFEKVTEIEIDKQINKNNYTENDFLNQNFNINLNNLKLGCHLIDIIESRIKEIKNCIEYNAPLSVIFLSGSTLEGILLNCAEQYAKKFNTAISSPKEEKDGKQKIKNFNKWTLSNFIDTAYEIGIIKEDVKKFSHILREFRNYIHPYEQSIKKFNPDIHTAEICFKVLEAAIYQISEYVKNNN